MCALSYQEKISSALDEAEAALAQLRHPSALAFLDAAASQMADCFRQGGKILIAGNGGSLCEAAHFAEECVGKFRKKRPALPVISLNDSGYLTCVANDFGYEEVFARGVEAFGRRGDLFVGLSTSGNSENIVRGFAAARALGLGTIALLGAGGRAAEGADLALRITECETSDRIQEAHLVALHILVEQVEVRLFDR